MPISFCDQSTKKPVINQMINHEKALNFNKVGNDYFKNGYYKDAIDSYKQALKLFISSHGEEHKYAEDLSQIVPLADAVLLC